MPRRNLARPRTALPLLVLLFAIFLALPAAASTDWPALYKVVNVASDDVLNVRAAPNPRAEIIGTLAHDTQAIEIIAPDESGRWGMVNAGERTGWVSLIYLERQGGGWMDPPTEKILPSIRDFAVTQCFGTEPFWSLRKQPGDDTVTFELLGDPPISGTLLVQQISRNAPNRMSVGALLERRPGAPQGDMLAIMRGQHCSDGMSDRTFGIDVDLLATDPETTGERRPVLLSGCCTIAPAE